MTVRWGFLGAGHIATKSLGPAVERADGAVLQAVAARDLGRARALADAHSSASGTPRAYDDYAALLEDPDVDAVYVALANDAHETWATAALAHGKHVLCEKPLGMSAAEVEVMAAAADLSARRLVEAFWYLWHPRVRRAREVLGGGVIGDVRHVSATFSFDGVAAGNYRLDPARGGGALLDVGCYCVSAVLWAMGGPPQEVVARVRTGPTGVDLTTEVVLSWADGRDAQVHCSIDEPRRQSLVVTGERGEVELPDPSFGAGPGVATELWVSDGSGTERTPFPAVDAYALMVEGMSAVLEGRDGWVLPLAESRTIASVLDAVAASAAHGSSPVRPG